MKTNIIFIFIFCFLINATSFAQFDPSQRQLSFGLKSTLGPITYGSGMDEETSLYALSFAPTVRYEYPVRLFSVRDNNFYLRLVGATGFTYVKSKPVYLKAEQQPNGEYISVYHTPHPLYVPLTAGLWVGNKVACGTDFTYWKGLNACDMITLKALSFMFNAEKFKTGASFELSQALYKPQGSEGFLFSFEFYWNLNRSQN